jgi:TRAP-type uncharacterized transport system fused permease subunit
VFSVFIFLFVLFGSLLERMGPTDFYVKLSIAAARRLRGGPAAAVFASGLRCADGGDVSNTTASNAKSVFIIGNPIKKLMWR